MLLNRLFAPRFQILKFGAKYAYLVGDIRITSSSSSVKVIFFKNTKLQFHDVIFFSF